MTDDQTRDSLLIPAALAVADARPQADALRKAVADMDPARPCTLDLDGWPATQPALQLCIAAARALHARGAAPQLGPHATSALAMVAGVEDRP